MLTINTVQGGAPAGQPMYNSTGIKTPHHYLTLFINIPNTIICSTSNEVIK